MAWLTYGVTVTGWGGDVLYEHRYVVDRAFQRAALHLAPSMIVTLAVAAGSVLAALLHWSTTLPWGPALVAGAVGAPLSVAAVMLLRSMDTRRRLPVGIPLVFRVRESGVQFGLDGRERSRPWSEVTRILVFDGSVVVRSVHGDDIVIPAEAVGPEGAERLCAVARSISAQEPRQATARSGTDEETAGTAEVDETNRPSVRLDPALADSLAAAAAEVIVRPIVATAIVLMLLSPVAAVLLGRGAPVPHLVGATFLGAVLVRWLLPAAVRRSVRKRLLPVGRTAMDVEVSSTPGGFRLRIDNRAELVGWAQLRRIQRHRDAVVLVSRDGSPRLVLPVEAFPAPLLAEGRRAVATARVA
ncbi:hypothetical protein [Phycicoccus sonneratiae]|uniref:YcxB family protein n=1 Tax=Phycicoccus sonneratiae TaxID=2807628 RepID=A0ABS2CH44_9MICO|nr:hypothetical protein [Phycicoccus sonneraticus]MBM6399100.1 hypothetical protein [Phycicoccus sonneraticus]